MEYRACSCGYAGCATGDIDVETCDCNQPVCLNKVNGNCLGSRCKYCEPDEEEHRVQLRQRKRSKRERYVRHKNHLRHLHKAVSERYPTPVVYTNEIWIKGKGYVENPKPYYKRLYRNRGSKYLKRQSNRKIRRYRGELHRGNSCHRLYDFWWEYC